MMTLCSAYNHVNDFDGQLLRPDAAQIHPQFVLVGDRLHPVSHETRADEEIGLLLVPTCFSR